MACREEKAEGGAGGQAGLITRVSSIDLRSLAQSKPCRVSGWSSRVSVQLATFIEAALERIATAAGISPRTFPSIPCSVSSFQDLTL